jgi:hypothetical protein
LHISFAKHQCCVHGPVFDILGDAANRFPFHEENAQTFCFAFSFDIHVGETSAGGFVVGLQKFGYDAALCRYGVLHSTHGRRFTVFTGAMVHMACIAVVHVAV